MSFLTCIAPRGGLEQVALRDLGESHGISERSARMYERFYELRSVLRCSLSLQPMLADVLARAAARLRRDDLDRAVGTIIYCKTQSHNTVSEADWLPELAATAGLGGWDCFTLSMTNCASVLAATHWALRTKEARGLGHTVILIAGEKAFHPAFSRLSVGLLSERPVSIILDETWGDWRVRGSFVSHLPRFHCNPDDMALEDKRALNDAFYERFHHFLRDALATDPDFATAPYTVVPYNLNLPLLRRLAGEFGWEKAMAYGDIACDGHMYCADIAANLCDFTAVPRDPTRVFAFAAGMGVTYAALFLERSQSQSNH
jgi:3-oxoacyl-[acyl-carrier-protein] synthase III